MKLNSFYYEIIEITQFNLIQIMLKNKKEMIVYSSVQKEKGKKSS